MAGASSCNYTFKAFFMNFRKRVCRNSVSIILAVLLFAGTSFAGISGFRNAPEFKLGKWMTQNPPNVDDLDGRVYVVDFWASWCAPCIKGMDELNEINEKYKKDGLVFLSLCQSKSPEAIKKIIREKDINFHVAIDMGTIDGYDVKGYPTVAVVDHKGRIAWQGHPSNVNFEKSIRKSLDAVSDAKEKEGT